MPINKYEKLKIGDKIHRFIILDIFNKLRNNGYYRPFLKVKCECGTIKDVSIDSVRRNVKSCGCYANEWQSQNGKDNRKHGLHNHKLYKTLDHMIDRCYKTNSNAYKYYGERGIFVCDNWNSLLIGKKQSLKNFILWANNHGYQDNLTIDRIDNDGNYCPCNCRFVTREIQAKNKRRSKIYYYNGEGKILADWGRDERCVVTEDCLKQRLDKGVDFLLALTTPKKQKKNFYMENK